MDYLKNDDDLEKFIVNLIENYNLKIQDKNIHENVLDPFSSIIEASINNLTFDNWIKAEKTRQYQKTLQNTIGNLHQQLLSNIKGVEDLGVGSILDVICKDKKIIAEIKNKHNTTKGNHKKEVYDNIARLLEKDEFKGFTGYYVEIIPKKSSQFNEEFTPPDNTTKINRPSRKNIRKIDGKSFYELLTGDKDAIFKIYDKIVEILKKNYNLKNSEDFRILLDKAYGKKD